jgi:hypothetical protein
MANHGTDPSRRFSLMRERVEAMKAIWTETEASYHGKQVDFERIWSWPKPAQLPHPPVMIGGDGPKVLDRVLRYGDGWMPRHGDATAGADPRVAPPRRRGPAAATSRSSSSACPRRPRCSPRTRRPAPTAWCRGCRRRSAARSSGRSRASRRRWPRSTVSADEYVLDTPVVREFVAGVRATIAASGSPAEACDAIRPRFASLLADDGWLPERYQEGDPDSGMGGGIGQWLLFRAGDRSLTLFALVVPARLPDADPRPPGVGPRRALPRHPGRGDLRARRRGVLDAQRGARAAPGDFYALLPPRDDIHRVRTTSPRRRCRCTC